jgi:hypothetical protein
MWRAERSKASSNKVCYFSKNQKPRLGCAAEMGFSIPDDRNGKDAKKGVRSALGSCPANVLFKASGRRLQNTGYRLLQTARLCESLESIAGQSKHSRFDSFHTQAFLKFLLINVIIEIDTTRLSPGNLPRTFFIPDRYGSVPILNCVIEALVRDTKP